jgi:nicotinamide-nucleotide amidase
MKAEILSTGNEVVSGTIVDTNAAHIAGALEEIGLEVSRHLCVGDDIKAIVAALKDIGGSAEMAVVSGGLGPTADDLTAAAAAAAAGSTLVHTEEARSVVQRFFDRLGKPVTDANLKQALLPEGARCLDNPRGSAPGFCMTIGACRFFFLPGVPSEMKAMLTGEVLPWALQQAANRSVRITRTMSTFGLPESELGRRIQKLSGVLDGIQVGTRLHFPLIDIRMQAAGADRTRLEGALEMAATRIAENLGGHLVSPVGASMEAVVGNLLRDSGKTLAVAESCTGGLIASRLTDVAGSSDYFLMSAVTYSNAAKISQLGVLPATIEENGAVDETTVREMAEGVRREATADYGLATSGIAGPGGGTDTKPVGTVCIGVATGSGSSAYRFTSPFKDRLANKVVFAVKALDLLRGELVK